MTKSVEFTVIVYNDKHEILREISFRDDYLRAIALFRAAYIDGFKYAELKFRRV